MNAVCVKGKQTLSPFICVFVCKARTAAIITSNKQQARHLLKEPELKTRRCETKQLYERMAISHPPFRPFSHRDFHSKRLIPPKVLYLTCVRDKSENLKQQNPNGEFSKW